MKVLIAYATYSSGTQTASEVIEDVLNELQYSVTRKIISEVAPEELGDYDMVIFGSPSWWIGKSDGQPHHLFLEFFKKAEGKQYPQTLFVVFGLGDVSFAHFCGAVSHLEEFVNNLHGVLIKPSLKVDSYYFKQEENDQIIKDWIQDILKNLPSLEGRPSHL